MSKLIQGSKKRKEVTFDFPQHFIDECNNLGIQPYSAIKQLLNDAWIYSKEIGQDFLTEFGEHPNSVGLSIRKKKLHVFDPFDIFEHTSLNRCR